MHKRNHICISDDHSCFYNEWSHGKDKTGRNEAKKSKEKVNNDNGSNNADGSSDEEDVSTEKLDEYNIDDVENTENKNIGMDSDKVDTILSK